MMRVLLIITAVFLTVASGAAYAMGVGGSSGFSWNQVAADTSARAWAAEGWCFPGGWFSWAIHVPLYSRRCLLTALTSVSTSLQIDFGGWRPSGNGRRRCAGERIIYPGQAVYSFAGNRPRDGNASGQKGNHNC
jgi:hypothetical protein